MALKAQPTTACVKAWNTSTNAPVTGDADNWTIKVIKDGTAGDRHSADAITEPDATNAPGVYAVPLDATDMTATSVCVGGKSSTANVVLIGWDCVTEGGNLNAKVGDVAYNVWEEHQSWHEGEGSMGQALNAAESQASKLIFVGNDVKSTLDGEKVTASTVEDKAGYALSAAGVGAVQSGLSTLTAQQVWEYAQRTLTGFGTLVADIWANATRTLTAIVNVTVGGYATGQSPTEALAAYDAATGADVTVAQNAITGAIPTPPTAAQIRQEMDANSADLNTIIDNLTTLLGRLTAARAGYIDKLNVTGTLANTTNADSFKADVSELALESSLTAMKGATWSAATDTLEQLRNAIDGIDVGSGTGGIAWPHTVMVDGSNYEGATVTYYTDSVRTQVAATGVTGTNGTVTFSLDAGHYYVAVVVPGEPIAYDEEDVA